MDKVSEEPIVTKESFVAELQKYRIELIHSKLTLMPGSSSMNAARLSLRVDPTRVSTLEGRNVRPDSSATIT